MSEKSNEQPMQVYDVALWCVWPSLFPDHVGSIEANGSYAAVVFLMESVKVEKVAYAAARQFRHSRIDRWSKLYMPLTVEKRGSR